MNTTESSPSPMDNLNALIRQAEMQKVQLELEVQFKRNIELFKKMAPEIYDQFFDYSPEELRISYDAEGHINLVNYELNNKPVYESDPIAFCQQQVKDFMARPAMSTIGFAKSKIMNESHIHVKLTNALIGETEEIVKNQVAHCDIPVGLMVMTGCGLGYQIPLLLEKLDIQNLIIFDPHKDSFYASLHVVDWYPILSHFCQKGRMLKLFIGVAPHDAMAEIKLLTDKIGLHNLVYTFVYRHFNSKKEDEFIERYRKEFHLNAAGTGFFDDEQVSLAHTIVNLNNNIPLFKHDSKEKGLPPAFILGNGPSLDQHIDFILENQENAIIFSCGTTISSITKTGIKPDFHVEMERNINIVDWIQQGTTPEYRKGITLLCLNTAAPEAIALFDDACMAKKPNDIGERIIDDALGEIKLAALQLCNPTVTNAGLSYALAMGFKEIYLLGVDLGIATGGKHHSDLSIYYDLERKTKTGGHTAFDRKDGKYNIKGNFGGEVETNTFLDSTRIHMEILLRHYDRTQGDVKCYNPNNGALIDCAMPIKPEDINLTKKEFNKAELVKEIKKRHFIPPNSETITERSIKNTYLKRFFDIRPDITLKKKIDSPKALYHAINNIYMLIRDMKKDDPITMMLLRGSMNGYFTLIMKSCWFITDKRQFQSVYNIGRSTYMKFLKQMYEFMDKTPLKLDDTYDHVATKLQGDLNGSNKTETKKETSDQ